VYPVSQQYNANHNVPAAMPSQGNDAGNNTAGQLQNQAQPPASYYPQPYYPVNGNYNQHNSKQTPSVGAVGINIYNPTVGGQAHGPYYGPNYAPYPVPNQYVNQAVNQYANQPAQQPQQQAPQPPTKQDEPQKTETPKQAAPLSVEYVKSLENYLNNANTDIRLMGIKEVLNRFKEDKSRIQDQALTNLLNKALQDPSEGVRVMALATLDSGYAAGDDLTVQLLKNMQKSDAAYNQDALTASRVLLKLAGKNLQAKPGQKLDIQSNSNQMSQDNSPPQIGQNLNVVAK